MEYSGSKTPVPTSKYCLDDKSESPSGYCYCARIICRTDHHTNYSERTSSEIISS